MGFSGKHDNNDRASTIIIADAADNVRVVRFGNIAHWNAALVTDDSADSSMVTSRSPSCARTAAVSRCPSCSAPARREFCTGA